LVFAVIMAVASSGLVLALGFAERRRSFAILSALGARGRQIASFVWAEALFAAVGGAVLGAIGGSVEALIVVKILTGVFDPPPETLSVPWPYLAGVLVAMGMSVGLAAAVAVRAARRPALEIIRDL
jgi:putative ABC transport system permease protein